MLYAFVASTVAYPLVVVVTNSISWFVSLEVVPALLDATHFVASSELSLKLSVRELATGAALSSIEPDAMAADAPKVVVCAPHELTPPFESTNIPDEVVPVWNVPRIVVPVGVVAEVVCSEPKTDTAHEVPSVTCIEPIPVTLWDVPAAAVDDEAPPTAHTPL